MKIAIVGAGYVGMSLAVLLSQKNSVQVIDTNLSKVNMINEMKSPIKDEYISEYLKTKQLNLFASVNYNDSLKDIDYAIICTPTNYNEKSKHFDTSSIEIAIKKLVNINKNITIVIKSTIPIGYMNIIEKKYKVKLLFSPEFLREGHALYDNLYPSRIIVSPKNECAKEFASLLMKCSINNDVPILYMEYDEAAAVKLFSNTYLAMRVAFFNELDTFAEEQNMDSKKIIDGICFDKRIGNYYNNPSFGFGGYCLPKDIKQLLFNYDNIPQKIIKSIIESNDTRKKYISSVIINKHPHTVGVYRLIMKSGSDNYRTSAMFDIINLLIKNNISVIIYEPLLTDSNLINNCKIIDDLDLFKAKSSLIICNRIEKELKDVIDKVYTRDLYTRD